MQQAKMEPAGFFRRIPLLPHQMQARLTPTADMIVLCHLGVARLDRAQWSLAIDGLVERPRRLDFTQLTTYPKHALTSFHQCAGSPQQPAEPTQRICNVRWGGTRLADVLRDCGPAPNARYVWSRGADYGAFGGMQHEAYVKDLPIERVPSDVLIAYELNDAPLLPEHGFPARLVVPGFYGTNSVKWLSRLTLAQERAAGAFTRRWYNDPDPENPGTKIPVWSVAPQSVIVAPAPGGMNKREAQVEIWGWAWSDEGIARVDVSTDGGRTWGAAELETRKERSWQQFRAQWRPSARGPCTLCSRAISHTGTVQPDSGRRNAIYRVELTVE
ncbi:MAG TPA: molybdopterin-dependent oxidoreductase [Xanthobacteraceae bacterium]|jgi:DMSO/TMAO reductase YedYZ molybdopterin-dependent catalytic subunit